MVISVRKTILQKMKRFLPTVVATVLSNTSQPPKVVSDGAIPSQSGINGGKTQLSAINRCFLGTGRINHYADPPKWSSIRSSSGESMQARTCARTALTAICVTLQMFLTLDAN